MPLPLAGLAGTAAVKLATAVAGRIADSAAGASQGKLAKTARDFETMFLENTLDRLVSDVGAEGPLGENGTGGGVWRSMLVKEYAGSIVKGGGVGIAASVQAELLRMQEGAGRADRI